MDLAAASDSHHTSTIGAPARSRSHSATSRRQRLEAITLEAEALARANPAQYRRRVALLASLGYVVLGGTLALLLLVVVGGIWGALASTTVFDLLVQQKLGIVLVVLAWMLIRALWVRVESPQGRLLTRAAYPALFADIDAIRKRIDTPPIDAVVLTADFNASMVQTPRLGLIGPHKVTLVLGLELLLGLSRRQACAVLAHELGHLARAQGRFGNSIYRLRVTWQRSMQAFDDSNGVVTRALRKFFDWYAPYFNAYSFTLARASELEADRLSAQATTTAVAASALVCTALASQAVGDRFWKATYRRAGDEPIPPANVFTDLAAFVDAWRTNLRTNVSQLRLAIAARTELADTHPALKDRLDALGEYPSLEGDHGPSAARVWLGADYDRVLTEESQKWVQDVGDGWAERHRVARRAQAEMELLQQKDLSTLTQEERWNLAVWTRSLHQTIDPLQHFQTYAEAYPSDRNAHFVIGEIKLARGDRSGLLDLERALERHQLVFPACELAYNFLRQHDEPALAEQWLQCSEAQLDRYALARAERESLLPADELEPCSLGVPQIMSLSTQVGMIKSIKRAWIAQKRLEHFPDEPVLIVAYEVRGLFTRHHRIQAALRDQIDWPALTYFVPRGGSLRHVHAKVRLIGRQIIGA